MKLDRNTNKDGRGKYALIRLRDVKTISGQNGAKSHITIWPHTAVDFGNTPDTDFFVIRLKDKYAGPALKAYAECAASDDPEYAKEIEALAEKAFNHPGKKMPD